MNGSGIWLMRCVEIIKKVLTISKIGVKLSPWLAILQTAEASGSRQEKENDAIYF